MSAFIITIDGPSGSGKGTIANKLAQHYGYHLLDSGALYRLLGLAAEQAGLIQDHLDVPALTALAQQIDIRFVTESQKIKTLLNGEDVSEKIRTETVGELASIVAAVPELRAALFKRQQDFAQAPGLVADGRDMGTVVFPQAPAKIYLTASAEARADRRVKQLQGMGENVKIDAILADIQARDKRDMERTVAPLKPADDAFMLDSSSLGIEEVLHSLIQYIDEKQRLS